LAVSAITTARDLFFCDPFKTKLSAGACMHRQRAADPDTRRAMTAGDRLASGSAEALAKCRSCALGKAVAARLPTPVPTERKVG
jgi:hypothetical protein